MECTINNLALYYEVYGEGRPILFLHGWAVDHTFLVHDMEPIFQSKQGWQRIYLDLPGRGKSAAAEWIDHQDQILELLLAFIDTVLSRQRFVLAGLSYGGYLARAVVHQRAAQIDGLLLIVPEIEPNPGAETPPVLPVIAQDAALLAELPADQAERFKRGAIVQERHVWERLRDQVLPAVQPSDRPFLQRLSQNYRFSFAVDALPAPFPAPTLMLLGRQDTDVGFKAALRLVDQYPRGTFALLDRAGHFLPLEQELLYRTLVAEWLRRVAEYCAQRDA